MNQEKGPSRHNTSVDEIDALLPQTQCRLCNYEGCRPYAEAIINDHTAIDLCLPGGIRTLTELAKRLDQNPSPYLEDMRKKAKPAQRVVIREEECIGCMKCIQACPVDAIIGASKEMHTIIQESCTGCELCIPPCPVDCIDLLAAPELSYESQRTLSKQSKTRFENRKKRLERIALEKKEQHDAAKLTLSRQQQTLAARRAAITESVSRVQKNKIDRHCKKNKSRNIG